MSRETISMVPPNRFVASWREVMMCATLFVFALIEAPLQAQQLEMQQQDPQELMKEEHRTDVVKVVVLPGMSPSRNAITGSYESPTDGLIDGINIGRGLGTVNQDIGGIPISIPIPILALPGAIFGGLSGGIKRQIQDLRDALTEDLADSANSPLSSDALATDVFWRLRETSTISPKVLALTTPIPSDTDAILYVSFSESSINVEEDKATITFTATATLRRMSDGKELYDNAIHYQDTDLLKNWTKNENAAWRDYANFARHYVGREIAAELYERVDVRQELKPEETDSVALVKKDVWQGTSQVTTPTLAWDLTLDAGDTQPSWVASIDPNDIYYELEIYDMHQPVYSAKKIETTQHTVEVELEDCTTYRWSVRPAYRIDDVIRFGEWMRSNSDDANGNFGTAASVAAAYIYDFASLEIKCGRK
jgi:hypothetical protein